MDALAVPVGGSGRLDHDRASSSPSGTVPMSGPTVARRRVLGIVLAGLLALALALAGCGGSSEGAISPEEEEQIAKEYEEGTLDDTYSGSEYEETEEPHSQVEVEAEVRELDVERCYAEAETEAEELSCVEMDDELAEAE